MSRVAILVKGWPRLSETFIAQEILGLERMGLDPTIVSLRRPTETARHDIHDEIAADVLYLPEYLKDDPARVAAGRRFAARLPGLAAAEARFRADLALDPSPGRHRRWGQAAVLARELPAGVRHIHVHYLHTPASVARYTAAMRGLSWSFSAHAKDIWTTPEWELRRKLADAAWGATCTAVNADYLRGLTDRPGAVDLVYHGLDFARFPVLPERRGREGPVRVLSVCRAVEKKGLDDLLHALARLPADLDWRFEHVGGGALVPRLAALAQRLGIAARTRFLGPQPRDAVIEAYRRADIFVLASRIAKSGDRDGLPNVLMEAQAMGLPCVSTTVSAVPEVIEDGRTGRLVPPRDRPALAATIEALMRDPAQRSAIGESAASEVRRRFSPEPGMRRLAERFGLKAAEAA